MNLTPDIPSHPPPSPAWSQNARRTIAVVVALAVIVVTRQQVAGIERGLRRREGGRGGHIFVCVCVYGLKEGVWLCVSAVALPWGE